MPHHSALAVEPDVSEPFDDLLLVEIPCWNNGLVTVAAIGPQGVSTREWMSIVWDRVEESEETDWMKGAIETLLLSDWRDTVELMRCDPSSYVPKLVALDDVVAGARFWAEGFRAGMGLRPSAWRQLAAEPELRRHLEPILLLLLDDAGLHDVLGRQPFGPSLDVDEVRHECIAEIPAAVAGIYRYWHRRGAPVHAIGRNDPCPCGSGRKYKKCCLR